MPADGPEDLTVGPVHADDAEVLALVAALDAELAAEGYTDEQSFGYPAERLAARGVHLVGVRRGGALVGLGGLEVGGVDDEGRPAAELKRMYVTPEARGTGAADAVLDALLVEAARRDVEVVRLETGVHQHAALRLYRRHGFVEVDRFGAYVGSATSVCLALALRPGRGPGAQ